MKPRIGLYVSEQIAARLTAAAKRSGKSKSALVEAALQRVLRGVTGIVVAHRASTVLLADQVLGGGDPLPAPVS